MNIEQLEETQPKSRTPDTDFKTHLMYGSSPDWTDASNTDPDFKIKVMDALNWANGMFDSYQYKHETIEYLKSIGQLRPGIDSLSDAKFQYTGKIAWLINNKCPITNAWRTKLNDNIQILNNAASECLLENTAEPIDKAKLRAENKNQILQTKIDDYIGMTINEIDSSVLNKTPIDESLIYHKFSSAGIDVKIAKIIQDELKTKHKDLVSEANSLETIDEGDLTQFDSDQQFKNYVDDIENNINAYVSCINQLSSYLGNKKMLKKTEKKLGGRMKMQRITNQIKDLNFKVQDSEYKISSINPLAVVESKILVTFNTKTRKCSVYYASESEFLDIRGTTIQNFDEKKSYQIIIKDTSMLNQFQQGSLQRMNFLLERIKAKKSTVSGRINSDTILLKVFD